MTLTRIQRCQTCGLHGTSRGDNLLYCADCKPSSKGLRLLRQMRRHRKNVDIVADYTIMKRQGIDVKDRHLLESRNHGSYTLFMEVWPNSTLRDKFSSDGINVIDLDMFENKSEKIANYILNLQDVSTLLLLYPGKYLIPSVKEFKERFPECEIIVLALNNEEEWLAQVPGILIIYSDELPKYR